MKNHKQIFLLYSCDAWKSNDSMKLLTATTSTTRLRRFIESKIMSGDMRYADSGETYCERRLSSISALIGKPSPELESTASLTKASSTMCMMARKSEELVLEVIHTNQEG